MTMKPIMTQSGLNLDTRPMTGTTGSPAKSTYDGDGIANIPVFISTRRITHSYRHSNQENLVQPPIVGGRNCLLPVFFCDNTRSVRNKLNDLSTSAKYHQADVVCVVESWLDEDIEDSS